MRPNAVGVVLVALVLLLLSVRMPGAEEKPRPLQVQQQALELLQQAREAEAKGDRAERRRLLRETASRFETLSAVMALPKTERDELARAAAEVRAQADSGAIAADAYRALLERVATALKRAPLGLSFQGSYSQTKVEEPVSGGHASAMGPPPTEAPKVAGHEPPSPVQFEAVAGLTEKTYCGGSTKDHIIESGGSGIAVVDYDGDGLLDIYVVNAFELDAQRREIPHRNALYHNLGNWKFENVAQKAGVDAAAWGNGVCAGDYDGDGRIDLYVTNWGANALFRNNGDGTFTDVAAKAGVASGGWSTGCVFFDANGDGKLDLYVARYATITSDEIQKAQRTMTWRGGPKVMLGPIGIPGAADVFFENRGDGTFVDATDARGLTDAAKSYGFGVLATDYDGDGWTDLFVANDSTPNFLYHNKGDGSFESVGLLAGVALNGEGRAQAGMGTDAGDYDGDGLLDVVMTAFAHDNYSLYRNLGGGQFEDASQVAGIAAPTYGPMGWGTSFLDADLDGRLDLFFANGHIYPQVDAFPDLKETFRQRSQLFLNDGKVFRDVSETAGKGLAVLKAARGLAVGDIDNDGDPDLVMNAMDDAPTLLENRQRTGHHWIGLQLKKAGANPFAIGARVTIETGGKKQMREVRSGGSYLSQSDLRPLFGLGPGLGPVTVEVRLGNMRWQFKDLPADRYTTLTLREEDRVAGH